MNTGPTAYPFSANWLYISPWYTRDMLSSIFTADLECSNSSLPSYATFLTKLPSPALICLILPAALCIMQRHYLVPLYRTPTDRQLAGRRHGSHLLNALHKIIHHILYERQIRDSLGFSSVGPAGSHDILAFAVL